MEMSMTWSNHALQRTPPSQIKWASYIFLKM